MPRGWLEFGAQLGALANRVHPVWRSPTAAAVSLRVCEPQLETRSIDSTKHGLGADETACGCIHRSVRLVTATAVKARNGDRVAATDKAEAVAKTRNGDRVAATD